MLSEALKFTAVSIFKPLLIPYSENFASAVAVEVKIDLTPVDHALMKSLML